VRVSYTAFVVLVRRYRVPQAATAGSTRLLTANVALFGKAAIFMGLARIATVG
jgi:hypothetical protein